VELAIGIIVAVVFGLIGVVWHQVQEKIREHKEHCDKEVDDLWHQIGRDSSSGMRFKVHNSTPMSAHAELEMRVRDLERR
jgi:hypothetical protein